MQKKSLCMKDYSVEGISPQVSKFGFRNHGADFHRQLLRNGALDGLQSLSLSLYLQQCIYVKICHIIDASF